MGAFLKTFEKGVKKTPVEQWFWDGVRASKCCWALVKVVFASDVQVERVSEWCRGACAEGGAQAAMVWQVWHHGVEGELEVHLLLLAEDAEELNNWQVWLEHLGLMMVWCKGEEVTGSFLRARVRDLLLGRSEYYQGEGWQLQQHNVLARRMADTR